MTTIFTRILRGEVPAHFVARTPTVAAFLSIAPLTAGHVLVVPVEEVDHWTALSPGRMAEVMAMAQSVGRAVRAAFDAPRAGLIIAGFEVPHAHVHVFPARSMDNFDFRQVKPNVPDAELAANRDRIAAVLEAGPLSA
jgi:diadenosine tetraphosphate (Ap4A) HIT family hydrolase